jgi:gliding motility-associated-like protein
MSDRSVDFVADQTCAPVNVSTFRTTYRFAVPQDPASISIVYQWNDPANTVTTVSLANGLVVTGGNTIFTANANFLYTNNNNGCSILPQVSLYINGVECTSTRQVQPAQFWGRDNQANGTVAMAPENWDVCYNNSVVNAQFRDGSNFNCNPSIEQDRPNTLTRHVQFVYGTNHNAGSSIRNLTLNDGGAQPLTNATGGLASSTTRNGVTGAYFGPVEMVPFPAEVPTAVSFPMNAPANALNAIGNRFEVTMYNWNVCNPWNGDVMNPNYEDAIATTGYIVIVDAPNASYFTRDAEGVTTTDFCIDETIYFRNTSGGTGFDYQWTFFNDESGTEAVGSSIQQHPTFAYAEGGRKLVRLVVSRPTAQGSCDGVFEGVVNITPALSASIGVLDELGNPLATTFCQEVSAPYQTFSVRFVDQSTGTVTANTRWRWEFYNESNVLIESFPAGAGFSSTFLGPFDRVFQNPGNYRVVLRIRDLLTSCESRDEAVIRVNRKPVPNFTTSAACESMATLFTDASTFVPVGSGSIVSYAWDLAYDGTFQSNPLYENQTSFEYTFPSANTYPVALQIETSDGCFSDIVRDVIINPAPAAQFSMTPSSGCSALEVTFTNTSDPLQTEEIAEYRWEVDDGNGYVVDVVQHPSEATYSTTFVRSFVNVGTLVNVYYQVRLRTISVSGCERVSASQQITVSPAPLAGFTSTNYSPFNSNCSTVSVSFQADASTIAQNPSYYLWTVLRDGVIEDQQSTNASLFTYQFENTTQAIQDYQVRLTTEHASGCTQDSVQTVRISPVPQADFTITRVFEDCEETVLAIEATQKGLSRYDWRLQINGITMFNSNTVGDRFEYTIPHSATVDQLVRIDLRTTNFANCESVPVNQTTTILRTDPLVVNFTATPPIQTLPNTTISLTNNSSVGAYTYHWDFGDGETSNNPAVTAHTYAVAGTYEITLTVSSSTCESSYTVTVQINPGPPILDFTYFPSSGCAPLTVSFINQSQFADPASYVWEFGVNEGNSKAVDPTYTYFRSGTYSVTLSASDGQGGRVSVTKDLAIDVFPTPTAQFAVFPNRLSIPEDVLYLDNRSSGATSYWWDFGDGTTSTDFEPSHRYQEAGDYDVTLIAYNALGCSDTLVYTAGVTVVKSGKLLIPNAFRPSVIGPGSSDVSGNEVFLPVMHNVVKFSMVIFNRWGELLFQTHDVNQGWDGYYKGVLCPQDVYVYKITVEYEDGKSLTKAGDLTLLR